MWEYPRSGGGGPRSVAEISEAAVARFAAEFMAEHASGGGWERHVRVPEHLRVSRPSLYCQLPGAP